MRKLLLIGCLFILAVSFPQAVIGVELDKEGVAKYSPEAVSGSTTVESGWQTDTPMTSARARFGAVSADGRIYAVAGDGPTEITAEVGNVGTSGVVSSWTLTEAPTASVGTACYWDGRAYAFTVPLVGQRSQIYSAVVTSAGGLSAWQLVGELPDGRKDFAVVAANWGLYLVGGADESALQQSSLSEASVGPSFQRPRTTYRASILPNGSIGAWQASSLLNEERSSNAAAAYNGYIYTVGGDGGPPLSSVEYAQIQADGTLSEWQVTSPMLKTRQYLPVVVANGYLYAIGGLSSSYEYTVERAAINPDGTLGAGEFAASMAKRRATHAAVVAGAYIYAIGGNDMYNNLSSVERLEVGIDQIGPQIASFHINGQATSTPTTTVILGIQATDQTDAQGQLSMSFSNDGSNWSGWRAYASQFTWDLGSTSGVKTVYARVRDPAGNVSMVSSDDILLDLSVPAESGVSINDGAMFVNQTGVMLTLGATVGTSEMQISNDGGFAGASWEPYATHKAWNITPYGSYVIPRVVYVRYRDVNGLVSGTYHDDIVLDVTAPTGSIQATPIVGSAFEKAGLAPPSGLAPTSSYSYTVHVPAVSRNYCPSLPSGPANYLLSLGWQDDVSGVNDIMVSSYSDFRCGFWEPAASAVRWFVPESADSVYLKLRDRAGNVSQVYVGSVPR